MQTQKSPLFLRHPNLTVKFATRAINGATDAPRKLDRDLERRTGQMAQLASAVTGLSLKAQGSLSWTDGLTEDYDRLPISIERDFLVRGMEFRSLFGRNSQIEFLLVFV
jgi:hypothetical protein